MRSLLAALVGAAWLCWPQSRAATIRVALRAVAGVAAGCRAAPLDPPPPRAATAEEIATAIDLLSLTLSAGVGVVEAIEAVARRLDGPAGHHLATVAAALRWGVEDALAWAAVPAAWRPAARALQLAAVAGVPPAELLTEAAADLRRAEAQRVDLATARVGVRIVLPLGLAFLPAFVLSTVIPVVLALTHQVLGR